MKRISFFFVLLIVFLAPLTLQAASLERSISIPNKAIGLSGAKAAGKGGSSDILRLAEQNIAKSGDTVLGSYPGYITKANAKGQGTEMEELQRVLKEWLNFFLADERYKVTNTKVGPSFNDALVDFFSDRLTWRLVNDRAQLLLSCTPRKDSYIETESYSLDLLFRLVQGQRLESAILAKEKALWLEENIGKIEELFSPGSLAQTVKELKKLKTIRTKELFG